MLLLNIIQEELNNRCNRKERNQRYKIWKIDKITSWQI